MTGSGFGGWRLWRGQRGLGQERLVVLAIGWKNLRRPLRRNRVVFLQRTKNRENNRSTFRGRCLLPACDRLFGSRGHLAAWLTL